MTYVFTTPSGESHVTTCKVREVPRVAAFWSQRWNEPVTIYSCKLIKSEVYFKGYNDYDVKGVDKAKLKRITQITMIKAQLNSAIKQFNKLGKRGSFSGLHLSGEIDRLQHELDAMGDKSERFYPEITIEVG